MHWSYAKFSYQKRVYNSWGARKWKKTQGVFAFRLLKFGTDLSLSVWILNWNYDFRCFQKFWRKSISLLWQLHSSSSSCLWTSVLVYPVSTNNRIRDLPIKPWINHRYTHINRHKMAQLSNLRIVKISRIFSLSLLHNLFEKQIK